MFTENKLNTAKSNKRTKETKIDNNDQRPLINKGIVAVAEELDILCVR